MREHEAITASLRRLGVLPTVEGIARKYGVRLKDMLSYRRTATLVSARQEAWAIIRHTLALSYPEIGAAFGRDHTTIIHGVRVYERRLEREWATP